MLFLWGISDEFSRAMAPTGFAIILLSYLQPIMPHAISLADSCLQSCLSLARLSFVLQLQLSFLFFRLFFAHVVSKHIFKSCHLLVITIFTTIATHLAIWLANLPLSIRVQTTLLASMCHAMPFSAWALKKHFLWRFVKNKSNSKRCLYSCRQRYASSQWSKFVVHPRSG